MDTRAECAPKKTGDVFAHADDDIKIVADSVLRDTCARVGREWVVYVLVSHTNPRRTYCGVTNHLTRRLRQHNGELAGGARATLGDRPWCVASLIRGFGSGNHRLALRTEWFCKIGRHRGSIPGRNGLERRLWLIKGALRRCNPASDGAARSKVDHSVRVNDDGEPEPGPMAPLSLPSLVCMVSERFMSQSRSLIPPRDDVIGVRLGSL